ncbi:MAG: Biopolymer transport protein ExbB [Pseudomonadota bacterium]|jgi:biopolymer transport protein ExbB
MNDNNIDRHPSAKRLSMARCLGLLAVAGAWSVVQAQAVAVAADPAAEPANPYGLAALWAQGDLVAKATLLILLVMSLASWTVLLTRWWDGVKLAREARTAGGAFFDAASVDAGMQALPPGGAYRVLTERALHALRSHQGEITQQIDRNAWVMMNLQRALDERHARLQDGLSLLATVGSTAPFVGLFGTVWGIYHALTAIGIAGQASLDKVAGPVGEALIMTAIGLAVAVPAVLGYNALVRRNKLAMEPLRAFGSDLHGLLMGARPLR